VRETDKLNITSFTNTTTTNNNINNKRNNTKIYKTDTEFPGVGCQALASRQQLPGSTRQSQCGLSSRQELESGVHGSESGSGSQAEQRAGSSTEGGHE